jgi:hypothetical protein
MICGLYLATCAKPLSCFVLMSALSFAKEHSRTFHPSMTGCCIWRFAVAGFCANRDSLSRSSNLAPGRWRVLVVATNVPEFIRCEQQTFCKFWPQVFFARQANSTDPATIVQCRCGLIHELVGDESVTVRSAHVTDMALETVHDKHVGCVLCNESMPVFQARDTQAFRGNILIGKVGHPMLGTDSICRRIAWALIASGTQADHDDLDRRLSCACKIAYVSESSPNSSTAIRTSLRPGYTKIQTNCIEQQCHQSLLSWVHARPAICELLAHTQNPVDDPRFSAVCSWLFMCSFCSISSAGKEHIGGWKEQPVSTQSDKTVNTACT